MAIKKLPLTNDNQTVILICDTSRTYSEVWVNDPDSSSKGHVSRFNNPKDAHRAFKNTVEGMIAQGWTPKHPSQHRP